MSYPSGSVPVPITHDALYDFETPHRVFVKRFVHHEKRGGQGRLNHTVCQQTNKKCEKAAYFLPHHHTFHRNSTPEYESFTMR